MAKNKIAFFCQSCGHESPKWTGKCSNCGEWNTLVEELITKENTQKKDLPFVATVQHKEALPINAIHSEDAPRYPVLDAELHRTLGGGLVQGSVTLIAGEPGIGKSTLFLQMAMEWQHGIVLYVSGEESLHQIKMRANRIAENQPESLFLLSSTDTHLIFKEAQRLQPTLIIIDSIQTLSSPFIESAAGSVAQVRTCAAELATYAKSTQTPVVMIGHITKDGVIAGPKVLEHMVDTVLQFEGDRNYLYRILRTLKNRFGANAELGIYEMQTHGMKPVPNPSELLLSQHTENISGIALAATIEGLRPIMIEIQALVGTAVYGTPQRTVSGLDGRRLQLLLAVLEKRGGFHFGAKDVFVNIAGGLKIEDPSIELALVAALLSSYEDKALPANIALVGEVGLSGEVRSVSRIEARIAEAEKLGMDLIVIPKGNAKGLATNSKIAIKAVQKVEELYQLLF